MKKLYLILSLVILIQNNKVSAQITLDHTVDSTVYGYYFYPAKISNNETKYVFLDTTANTFSLYNLDFSPFLTNIVVPHKLSNNGTSGYFYHIMYISRSLFDCDTSNIEYLFASQNEGNNPLWVMRTDGTVLLRADSSIGPYCLGCPGGTTLLRPILNTEAGTKLITMYSGTSSGPRKVSIYSLCGNLPSGNEEYDFASQETAAYVELFPNPSSMQLNFKINLPDNLNDYELVILNDHSQELRKEKLRNSETMLSIDIHNYTSGVYYYSIASKLKVLKAGKFVLTK